MTQPLMKKVVVEQFGGLEQLQLRSMELPEPDPGDVRIRLTSIGMNHADLMARQGQYRLSSGDPPFSPGIEAGGVIDAVGRDVKDRKPGQRVVVSPDAPRTGAGGRGGTYASHYFCSPQQTYLAPDKLPDEQLGTLWLPFLTAWGCLIWKHGGIKPGMFVAMPAASSSVALAAAQIVKKHGGTTIGLTTSVSKVAQLREMDASDFDHVVVTRDPNGQPCPWFKDLKRITGDHGVDLFFDPVAAGPYLESEIRSLAQFGTVYVYGLLGEAGKVDVTPLIRKHGAIRGWALTELVTAGREQFDVGCRHILEGFADGSYRQHVDATFKLDEVRHAQETMEKGKHIGKLVLVP